MGIQLKVLLEPDLPLYYSGQDVCGRVLATADMSTACTAILVKVKGYCGTDFTKDDEEHHSDEEVYFENTITVWSGHDHGMNLMPGEYGFPFQYCIPPRVPSSYEGLHGHVRYEVEAKAESPWGTIPTALARFKISSTVDLTAEFDERLNFKKEDTICCCCCEEGPFTVNLYAERTGYLPGESVLISGNIKNRTDTSVNHVAVTLIETIRFRAGGSSKKQQQELQTITESGFLAGADKEWRSVRLRIPETAICLLYCSLITADYTVRILFDIGCWSSISLEKDIVVGNLPPLSVTQFTGGDVTGIPPPFATVPPTSATSFDPLPPQPPPSIPLPHMTL